MSRASQRRTSMVRAVAIALFMAVVVLLVVGLGNHSSSTSGEPISTGASTTTTSVPMAPPTFGAPKPIAISSSAANGRTRIERSLPCNGGHADSGYWHFQAENPLAPGVLTAPTSSVPGDLRLYADVHSPNHTIRTSPEPIVSPGPTANAAYLPPSSSRVALSNARGTVKLGLVGGACPPATMPFSFDGSTAAGAGTWSVISSSGSYRQATGSGSYTLNASVLPGADNPWALNANGTIAVLQPKLDVRLVDTFWGRDGVDYAARQLAAVYQVTNIGAGDSFGAALTAASSPTPGASLIRISINGYNLLLDGNTPVGGFPRSLGDLSSGEQVTITVVWQLPLPAGKPPCGAVILNCSIDTTLTLSSPDALDVPVTKVATLPVKAPNLPPPA